MDSNTIVSHLKAEIARMQQVVSLLETPSTNGYVATPTVRKRTHTMTPAGRRALSRAMKARWAAKKKS